MKKKDSSTSFISSFFTIIIVIVLLLAFGLMGYNQHLTNERIHNALDYIIDYYETSVESEATDTSDDHPQTDGDNENSNREVNSADRLELSSAIAYLSKVQEVASNNNTTALLSLMYALISSLILSYGAKMLRLGENDKQKLSDEIKEKCQEDISCVNEQLQSQAYLSNVIAASTSAIVSFQTLKIALLKEDQGTWEASNKAFLDCVNTLSQELEKLATSRQQWSTCSLNFISLEVVYSLFQKNCEEYTTMVLPPEIDDKKTVMQKFNNIDHMFTDIKRWQKR